ncbi:MAG: PilZ domain-containing protein [Thermodesulfobacteriota bacterium]
MLKVECPKCKEWVHSPFLVEMEEMTCPSCGVEIPVEEVYISAGPYSISRDVLMKHFFKYRRLLTEAASELEELKKEGEGLKTYDITAENVTKFMKNLEELLAGCRSGFRISPGDKKVNYFVDGASYDSKLINISMTGICIDGGEGATLPGINDEITIELVDNSYSIKVEGIVVRVDRSGTMGIQFAELGADTKKALLDYVLEKGK